jgi:hypothetical protein
VATVPHELDIERARSGHWGTCSCGGWSTGPRTTKTKVRSEFVTGHLRQLADQVEAAELPVGWPKWDDPDDWAESLSREEVMAAR